MKRAYTIEIAVLVDDDDISKVMKRAEEIGMEGVLEDQPADVPVDIVDALGALASYARLDVEGVEVIQTMSHDPGVVQPEMGMMGWLLSGEKGHCRAAIFVQPGSIEEVLEHLRKGSSAEVHAETELYSRTSTRPPSGDAKK